MKKILSLLFVILIISCSEDSIEEYESIDSKENSDIRTQKHPLLKQLIEQGFDKENIEEFEEYFLVEGDILFWKERNYTFKRRNTKQRSYPYGSVEISPIRVYINSNMNTNWKNAAQSAISRWNNTDSGIELITTTNSYQADISIMYDTQYSLLPLLGSGTWGQGDWPSSGNPGKILRINPDATLCSETQNRRIGLIQHELGHNLGLMHTDSNSGNFIPGTLADDPNSIMNSGNVGCYTLDNGFSYYDLVAVKYLYPKPNPWVEVELSVTYNYDQSKSVNCQYKTKWFDSQIVSVEWSVRTQHNPEYIWISNNQSTSLTLVPDFQGSSYHAMRVRVTTVDGNVYQGVKFVENSEKYSIQ